GGPLVGPYVAAANDLTYSPPSQSLSPTAGGAAVSFSQDVTAPAGSGTFTASRQVAGTGTNPIPSSWVSTSPTSLTFSTAKQSWIVSFTVPAGTPAGTYTAQIKANPSTPGVGAGTGTAVTLTVPPTVATTMTTITAPTVIFPSNGSV